MYILCVTIYIHIYIYIYRERERYVFVVFIFMWFCLCYCECCWYMLFFYVLGRRDVFLLLNQMNEKDKKLICI